MFFLCDVENCSKKFKSKSSLKVAKTRLHNINVKWQYCHLCDKKFKYKGDLKSHKKFIHNIDVKWFHCDVPNCDYKCKDNSSLKKTLRVYT